MARKFWLLLIALFAVALVSGAAADVEFGGVAYPEDAEYIDLGSKTVRDYNAFEAFLDQMPNLRQVDMFATEISASTCDRLAARYPQIKWGWTMVLRGKDHTHLIRTDYTSWSTLHSNKSSHHVSEDFHILKYCWNLMALDIGHNSVTNLDFLYDLPELRVLIIACNEVSDITPVASLHHLEYAELFKNRIADLTPLSGLDHLLDLNLCFNAITDWTPVSGLTQLKRLWIYSGNQYARGGANKAQAIKAAARSLKQSLPDTEVDYTHYSTAGTWRNITKNKLHPHYQAIIAMFGENHLKPKYEYVPFEDSWPVEDSAPETPEPDPQDEAQQDAPAEAPTQSTPSFITIVPGE